jgi:peptide/nickel transport system substrate-binding protein
MVATELGRREFLIRAAILGGVLGLPSTVLAACDSAKRSSSDVPAGEIGTLTWGYAGSVRSLDFAKSLDFTLASVLSNSLEGLLVLDKQGALQAALAESWSVPNPTTYVYRLRDGVRFWDGTPLTAEDVAFSLNRHIDPDVQSQYGFYFVSLERVEATGPREVVAHLKSPDPFFQYMVAHAGGKVTSKKFVEDHGSDFGSPEVLTMGTGPYQVMEHKPGESITMERNDDYWGDKPPAHTIVHQFIVDEQTRLLAMQAGEIDGAFSVSPDQSDQWSRLDGVNVISAPSLWSPFYELYVQAGPTSDIHVRRAIAYATDKEGLVSSVLRGHGRVASQIVAPEQWGDLMPPDQVEELYASFPTYEFDLDRARSELQQSAFPTFSGTAYTPDTIPRLGKAYLNTAENLSQLGVHLEVKETNEHTWNSYEYDHRNLGFHVNLWYPDYPDPANYPALTMNSADAKPGAWNIAHYKNPEVDRLLAIQQNATDKATRARALAEVLRITATDLPYVPLWWEDTLMAIREPYVFDGFNPFVQFMPWATEVKPGS